MTNQDPNEQEHDDQNDDDDAADQVAEKIGQKTLFIGAPFALSQDCTLLHPDPNAGIPGTKASVKCGKCSQLFSADLLNDEIKICPGCGSRYTHVLAMCSEDDANMALFIFGEILRENDALPQNPDGEGGNGDADEIPEADSD